MQLNPSKHEADQSVLHWQKQVIDQRDQDIKELEFKIGRIKSLIQMIDAVTEDETIKHFTKTAMEIINQ